MSAFLKIAAIAAAGFFRAGRHWPHEGVTLPVTDLTEADLARIRAEPNLHVQDAAGPGADQPTDDELRTLLIGVIAGLAEDQFDKGGKPALDALRAALPDHKALITAALRDEVWAGLKLAG